MTTLPHAFDEAEADVDHGAPWRYREPDAPNPLTIQATGWSTGTTKLGEAEFLSGIDRDGKQWSVLVGSRRPDQAADRGARRAVGRDTQGFRVVETLGRVQPGEVVSIKYLGDVEGARFTYPNFRVSRKPASAATEPATAERASDATSSSRKPAFPHPRPSFLEAVRLAKARPGPPSENDLPRCDRSQARGRRFSPGSSPSTEARW